MKAIISIGDNVIDKYIDLGMMFPGGNSLNVSVLAKRYGVETSYIGCIGSDREGKHIISTLKKEGVDISQIKILDGINAYANVKLINGDRKFVGNDRGVSRNIKLDDEDINYIKGYNIIHTSIYSGIEDLLPILMETKKNISFDFSNTYILKELEKILPYVNYAFFSGSHMTDLEIKEFQKKINAMGPELVLVTKGQRGATLYYEDKYFEQKVYETEVIDTLGAGDGFIARVLVGIALEEDVEKFLSCAAKGAAKICTYNGALGYGIDI